MNFEDKVRACAEHHYKIDLKMLELAKAHNRWLLYLTVSNVCLWLWAFFGHR